MARRTPPEVEAQVVADYLSGVTHVALSGKHSLSKSAVTQILLRNNVTLTGHMSPEEDRLAVDLYTNHNLTLRQVGDRIGRGQDAVIGALYRLGTRPRNVKEAATIRPLRGNRTAVNHHAFDSAEQSEEASYYVGLLLTDGCISRRRVSERQYRATVILSQSEEGKDGVEAFKRFVNSSANLSKKSFPDQPTWQAQYSIQVDSLHMVETLETYGVVPAKTSKQWADDRMAGNRHFWRGVIDGDGDLAWNNGKVGSPLVYLGNTSPRLMQSWLEYVQKLTGTKRTLGLAHLPSGKTQKRLYTSGDEAGVLLRELYTNQTICLNKNLTMANDMLSYL